MLNSLSCNAPDKEKLPTTSRADSITLVLKVP